MSHQHPHQHHHSNERADYGRPLAPDIIYSKDPWDPRRFAGPRETMRRLPRAAVWFSVAIIVFVSALVVWAIVASVIGK